MSFKIGFTAENENTDTGHITVAPPEVTMPKEIKKSLARVHFPARGLTCTYYNDMFHLEVGDIVHVEGKLEGLRGHVIDVSYNFKIKLSDYKRVIGVAKTNVMGKFDFAGSHFITLERSALPYAKAITWFRAPSLEKEEYEYSNGDKHIFPLDALENFKISREIADRGYEYYIQDRVMYIEIDNTYGRAIVEGRKPYVVEFRCQNGKISNLTCDCYCTCHCKHEFATLLQLRETIKIIEENYRDSYTEDFDNAFEYLAIINKSLFFDFVFGNKTHGTFTIGL